jgi:hypothetical protein
MDGIEGVEWNDRWIQDGWNNGAWIDHIWTEDECVDDDWMVGWLDDGGVKWRRDGLDEQKAAIYAVRAHGAPFTNASRKEKCMQPEERGIAALGKASLCLEKAV